MTRLSLIQVVAAIGLCVVAAVNAQQEDDILFPFGIGDASVTSILDVFSDVITPPMPVPFFGQSFSSLFVSVKGLISFGEGTTVFSPEPFPWDIPILAAFWSDIDIRTTGNATYRPYNRTSDSEVIFERGEAVVRQGSDQFGFRASWILIATWYEVPAYAKDTNITNTFQAVLLTDGAQSFVIYNYKEIRWGIAPDQREWAQVGYNAGYVTYHSVAGSLTDDIVNINERTNIGTRGRWLFHLSNSTIFDDEPPGINGCPDDAIIPAASTIPVPHSWVPPVFTDNSGQSVDVVFGCSATVSNECHQDGYGTFSVGDTKVMYNGTDASVNHNFCNFTVTITVVDLVCPTTFSVVADPGLTLTRVNWLEPDLTGWDETNLTSTAVSGGEFSIGKQRVTYHQWFGMYNLVLQCSLEFLVIGQCAPEVTEDAVLGTLFWPVTMAGLTAESIERCPLTTTNAGFPRATKNCSTAPPPQYFYWKEHVIQSCGEAMKTVTVEDIVDVDVTEGNAEEVAEFLVNQTSSNSSSSESDVEAISQILENIVSAGSGDPEVTDAVIETVSNVIMNAKETQDSPDSKSSSAIIQSVEAQVSLTLQQEGKVSIQQDTIHVEAVSIDPIDASNGFSFASVQQETAGSRSPQEGSLDGTEIKTFTNASEIPSDVVASIKLPANIMYLLRQGNSTTSLQASFIVYADDTLFQTGVMEGSNGTNNVTTKVAGSIVSLAVEGVKLKNLTDPVVIDFKILPSVSREDDTIKCVFWEFGEESSFWSTEGCQLAEITDDKVSCDCDHATNFAILVDVKGQKLRDDGLSFTPALDLISQIGGALSVAALAITVVIYLSISKLRTGKSRQIFIHFCFSLLMLYIVFLAGIDNGRGSGGWCVLVGALIHYLSLTTLMWMAVEARNMYVSTVKVFPEDTPRYMIKAGLLAWGSPLIVLTATLAAATESYKHDDYCFISPGLAMYLGLLTPIALILLHNVITFILVMRSLLKVKEASRSEQMTKRLQNAVGISALMGLTWCFGFLAIEGATFAFQLLFCLFNSLQGVVVFVMFCARREEVRAAVAPYLKRICCCRVCQAPELHPDRSYDLPTSQTALGTSSINNDRNMKHSYTALRRTERFT
ncbi:adhesion G-protein coupled receptor G4-like isoform X2 [Asterias rubens]|uniref:adhesion G-protein coupled receptor G4-like isoform X2 n=1 Tax=Asterias rubens TaxID=7604 RepID=UPI0014553F10|nr:adhesion G-protein coupled receptor G4-like isoform X2 [Asterias rubens]